MQVDISAAKKRLSQMIKAAHAGEDVVIANRGEPVARLVPASGATEAAETGSARAILDWLKAHPLPVHTRRSAKQIDAAIDEERGS